MFETNDKIIILKKIHNESNLCYYTKYEYLLKQKLNKKNIEYHIKIANCYSNNRILNCKYNSF